MRSLKLSEKGEYIPWISSDILIFDLFRTFFFYLQWFKKEILCVYVQNIVEKKRSKRFYFCLSTVELGIKEFSFDYQ